MASLKEIRTRIASVSSTQKITGAMKLVSAAKLRKAQTAILTLRPYSNKLNEILSNLSGLDQEYDSIPYFTKREPKNVTLIIISSNRGLCGSFNANIVKEVNRVIKADYAQQLANNTLKLICFGRKGFEQLGRLYDVDIEYHEAIIDNPSFDDLTEITKRLLDEFAQQKIDKIDVVYNRFLNPATQKVEHESFLPIQNEIKEADQKNANIDFLFDTPKLQLLEELIPKILKIKMFKSLSDSIASEHGARMTAMAKATDNANEMLKDLKLKYNNARQSSITTELLEIISGANALDA
ncbi:MAG: ATP synthase F1 subunit gamma [Bacteroidales bacterium]|jgi:F-type H+-transporting ATPase subunit gamma|nr:ATP synthase F1 subunit gamma [Bacteroidales bacterium]